MDNENNYPWLLRLNSQSESAEHSHDEPSDSSRHEDDDPSDWPKHEDDENGGGQHHDHDTLPADTFGLALSGGGIRSASFCLGVIQALARADWLKRLDYMSTVSGGGYIGSFLGRFFDNTHRPDLVRDALSDSRSKPIAWLRSHSNYLAPSGTTDTIFNLASFWRNFFAIEFVLAILAFGIFGVANAIEYYPWKDSQHGVFFVVNALVELILPLAPINSSSFGDLAIVTPWLIGAEIMFWLAVFPLSVAYWVVSQDRYEDFIYRILLASLVLSIAVLLATLWVGSIVIFAAVVVWILYTWWSVKGHEGSGNPNSGFHMAMTRNFLTNYLAFWLAVTFGVVLLALVDYMGKCVADQFLREGQSWSAMMGMGGGAATLISLIPILRGLANYLASTDEQRTGILANFARIPFLPTLLILTVGGLLPLVMISVLSHLVFELGQAWWVGFGATVVALVISFLLGGRGLIWFVNRSSLLTVYSARLARVFLGAVNPQRHRHTDGKNIGHVIYGDDVPLHRYAPHEGGGPLHLINVAVNETVDVASQRGIRDRKAENMAIGPAGINLSRKFHAIWTKDYGKPTELKPIGDLTLAHPFLNRDRIPVEVEGLNLREWIAISGAAVSPGMGRQTSCARSLLFTLTNLRLGYWWNSGIWSRNRFRIPMKGGNVDRIVNLFYAFLAPQALLVAELLGRFSGPWRRHWYLSDGGHFEFTGAYELLRRRVPFIIVVDAGADKKQRGSVLAWLTRLSRIDFGAEFVEFSASGAKQLGVPAEVSTHLGLINEMLGGPNGKPEKHAALFRVDFPESADGVDSWHGRKHSWVLYLKATVLGNESADILNYQLENPDFPNESTLDQFFDEPQWESYRKLGESIGETLFK